MYVISPSKTTGKEIEQILQGFEKGGYELVNVSLLWMPYYVVECSYQDKYGLTKHGKTTMNAMLYDDVLESRDLLFLFRPNFLKYEFKRRGEVSIGDALKKYREVKGSITEVDFRIVSRKMMEFIDNIRERLADLKSKVKFEYESGITRLFTGSRHALERLTSRFMREGLRDMEKEAAQLSSMEILTKIFLNLRSLPHSLEIRKKQEFYFPYLTICAKREEKELHEKYYFVSLVKAGRVFKKLYEDTLLARIVGKYKELKQIIKASQLS